MCTSCGRKGHLTENCFRKIGYPWWWGDLPRSKFPSTIQGSSGAASSSNGDRRVALVSSTMMPRSKQARVNQISASTPTVAANFVITNADRVGFSGLNNDQWKILVHMLNEKSPHNGDKFSGTYFLESWIIDT